MNDSLFETIIGAIVVCVALVFTVFAVTSDDSVESGGRYRLVAHFNQVNGLSRGSDVRLSGVKVGSVASVDLDVTDYSARVVLRLVDSVRVPIDSIAKVSADGLLGGTYLGIEPGIEKETIPSDGRIAYTRGSIDLLTLFAQFASSSRGDSE